MAHVYILTNYNKTVLYVGSTVDLLARVKQHRLKIYPLSFTAKYNVDILVYYEEYEFLNEARIREYQIKNYSRIKKEKLINLINPDWKNLFKD
jgi:putative endonuclease